MKRFSFILFSMFAIIFLAGCSVLEQTSGGGGESYFPHSNGYTWTYSSNDGGWQILTFEGTALVGSTTVQKYKGYARFASGHTSTSESYFRIDSTGVYSYGSPSYLLTTPQTMFAFPMEVGKTWEAGVSGSYTIRASVQAKENVTVPAGTFDCYKVKFVNYNGTVETYSYNIWLGNNAGMVKQTTTGSTLETVMATKSF
jgi:hypothetical protein